MGACCHCRIVAGMPIHRGDGCLYKQRANDAIPMVEFPYDRHSLPTMACQVLGTAWIRIVRLRCQILTEPEEGPEADRNAVGEPGSGAAAVKLIGKAPAQSVEGGRGDIARPRQVDEGFANDPPGSR